MRVVRWRKADTGVESFTITATGVYFPVGKTDSSFKLKLSMAAGGQTAAVDTVRDATGTRTGYGAMNVSGTTETKLGAVVSLATGIIVTAISGTLTPILDDEIAITTWPEWGIGRFPAKEDVDAYVYGSNPPVGLTATLPSGPVTWGAAGGGWVAERKLTRTTKICSVATRAAFPYYATWGSARQFMSRSGYRATANVSKFQLTFANWTAQGDTETAGSQSATIKAAIEYPIGTIAAIVTFGGAQIGVMAAGGSVTSDFIEVNLKYGELFAVRSFLDAPGGAPYFTTGPSAISTEIESSNFGTTSPDVTYTTAEITNTNIGYHYRPVMITGYSNSLSALLIGDSRMEGATDTASDICGETGQIARGLSPAISVINIGSSGATAAGFVAQTGYAKRMAAVAGMFDIVISNFGINDINMMEASTVVANLNAIPAITGKPTYQCTITPRTTSTDSWATIANQTPDLNNSRRVSVNTSIRAGAITNIRGFIEVAGVVESSRNSGKWKVDGTANLYTADGLHETQFANLVIKGGGEMSQFVAALLA